MERKKEESKETNAEAKEIAKTKRNILKTKNRTDINPDAKKGLCLKLLKKRKN